MYWNHLSAVDSQSRGKCSPVQNVVEKSTEAARPNRPASCFLVRVWIRSKWETALEQLSCVAPPRWLVIEEIIFFTAKSGLNGGEIFRTSASDACSPWEQFSFWARGVKASRWVTHPWTHLLRKSRRLNHRLEIWYGESPQSQLNSKNPWWTTRLLPEDTEEPLPSHSSIMRKLQVRAHLHADLHSHTPKAPLCLSLMKLDIYSLLYITTTILRRRQENSRSPEWLSKRKCEHSEYLRQLLFIHSHAEKHFYLL